MFGRFTGTKTHFSCIAGCHIPKKKQNNPLYGYNFDIRFSFHWCPPQIEYLCTIAIKPTFVKLLKVYSLISAVKTVLLIRCSFQNGPSPVSAATIAVTSYTEDPFCKCLRGWHRQEVQGQKFQCWKHSGRTLS